MLSPRIQHQLFHLWQRFGTWVLGIVGVLSLGFLWYYLATSGPAPVDLPEAPTMRLDDPRIGEVVHEVDTLEKKFTEIAAAGTLTDDSIAILDSAIEKQRQLLRGQLKPDYVQQEKLIRLEKMQDTARATRLVGRVEQLTKDAEEAQAANRLADAERDFKEALRLQRQINGGGAESKFKNYVRESALEQSIVSLAAYPLHLEARAAIQKAEIAMSEQRWLDALTSYSSARDWLERLNREYSRTRYADTATLSRVLAEIESLNAAGMVMKVAEQEKIGDNAEKASDHDAAAKAFTLALEAQQTINTEFSRSRFVSSAKIDTLEVKQQTARSQPIAKELENLERAIRDDLRLRRVVAAEQKLPQAGLLTSKLATEYPRSRYVDGALRIRLSYLTLKSDDLRKLQDEVYERLLSLPGSADRLLLGAEVPQGLYTTVMNTNPSRNPGRLMPVDSVNWNDATEFCTRMSWILGLNVRLPTKEEFTIALGVGDGDMRSSANGGRPGSIETARPNASGYRDLLGNLGEWLDADAATDKAVVAGGSYLDNPASLVKVPMELRSKVDRARHVGFRFLVDKAR
jgi:hypothetical protein